MARIIQVSRKMQVIKSGYIVVDDVKSELEKNNKILSEELKKLNINNLKNEGNLRSFMGPDYNFGIRDTKAEKMLVSGKAYQLESPLSFILELFIASAFTIVIFFLILGNKHY